MKLIPLCGKYGKGKFTKVDDADFLWLSKFEFWLMKPSGYAITSINGKNVLLHCMLNPRLPGLETDHINRDKLDNRRANLRYVTKSENTRNVARCDCQYGRGIAYRPEFKRPWQTRCSFGGKYRYIASFFTQEEAASAYVDYLEAVRKAPDKSTQIIEAIRAKSYGSTRSGQSKFWINRSR